MIGGISLRSIQPHGFAQRDLEVLERVSNQIAGATSALLAIDREQESRLETMRFEQESKARTDFLSMVTHELRTPLTAIVAFSDILSKAPLDVIPERQHAHIQVIQRNNRFLSQMIDDLLDLSRLELNGLTLNITEFPASNMIADALTTLRPNTDAKGQTLEHFNRTDNFMVIGDDLRLFQVLQNLLTNASKYSGDNTTIELHTYIVSDSLRVEVSDRGIGISPDEIQFLFEPFRRANAVRTGPIPGIGIGLYLAQQIITDHSGKIGVEPRDGGGTTAYFEVPLSGPEN
ncbi:MAG: HAMP domain-containing histidine kinase [Chloroflexi bacterium]|nr:HAMP domain-containing histidine kinase [Chloroflexota bacterium]